MRFQIVWNAFFKVKNEDKASRLIKQIESRTGHPIVSKQFERLKRDPSLLGSTFVTKLNDDITMEAAVFETLLIINNLGTNWTVSRPNITNDPFTPSEVMLSFEGMHSSPSFPGLTWILFVLETDTKLQYGWEHLSRYGTNFVNQIE